MQNTVLLVHFPVSSGERQLYDFLVQLVKAFIFQKKGVRMKTIETLVDEVIEREGGYSNHPNDRGGATNYGVTEAVARANGYSGDMRQLPRSLAVDIYKRLYWTRPGFEKVAVIFPRVAEEMFDTGVNMGVGAAAMMLQRALNALNREGRDYPDLKVDGAIGSATLRALDAFRRSRPIIAELVLLKALDCLQGARYIELAEQRQANEAFVFGWLAHRVGNVK